MANLAVIEFLEMVKTENDQCVLSSWVERVPVLEVGNVVRMYEETDANFAAKHGATVSIFARVVFPDSEPELHRRGLER